jgi:hypothetical protein
MGAQKLKNVKQNLSPFEMKYFSKDKTTSYENVL